MANAGERLSAEDVERLCSASRDGRDFIATTFDGLYFPRRRPRVPGCRLVARRRVGRRQAGARAQRAVPGGGVEAAARRVHGHDAALRRRPPAAAHAAGGALPRGRRALQRRGHPRRGALALRRRLHARPGRRRDRLPRPALRAAARRHVLRQALPLPRGPGDVLARPGDHVGDAHAQAAQAPHALRVQADDTVRAGPRCSSISGGAEALVVSYGSNADVDATELEALLARHRRGRCAGSSFPTGMRSAPTPRRRDAAPPSTCSSPR